MERKKKKEGKKKKRGKKAPCLVCHMDLCLLLAPASPKGTHGIPTSSPSTPGLVDTSLSPVAQAHKGREVLGGAASPTHSALRQKSDLTFGSSGNFHWRKLPAFPELQAVVSAFNLSCSLLCTAVCGFWYFPLMISVCYRLSGSALWLVGGVGQMLRVDCLQ